MPSLLAFSLPLFASILPLIFAISPTPISRLPTPFRQRFATMRQIFAAGFTLRSITAAAQVILPLPLRDAAMLPLALFCASCRYAF